MFSQRRSEKENLNEELGQTIMGLRDNALVKGRLKAVHF